MTGTEQFIVDNLLVILNIPIVILFVAFSAAIIREKREKKDKDE